MSPQSFYSNGKLLITAEYLVLDGAQALALPTQKGQLLQIEPSSEKVLYWRSLDENKNPWFETKIRLDTIKNDVSIGNLNDPKTRLLQILKAAQELNPEFLSTNEGMQVTTVLDFSRDWGLGSSSTLINNIANWAQIDAFKLLERTFGGSGYDIACAKNDFPIVYKLSHKEPIINEVKFDPEFSDRIFFIHLNQKQNTREAVEKYRSQPLSKLQQNVDTISKITENILKAKDLGTFENLIIQHETILSEILNIPPVKKRLFSDYIGSIKSLGGWGGDFIMVTGHPDDMNYFREKGFSTIIPYSEMILPNS